MAEDGSWDSIRRHGLLSTSALLDLFDIHGVERESIERRRRPEAVVITAEGIGSAVIRDNKPSTDAALLRCLDPDITPEEWFGLLNDRAFFWLSRKRLKTLLNAAGNRGRAHTVLTVDTTRVLEAHRDRIELSPINTGSTMRRPPGRGWRTFLPIADYPFDDRKRSQTAAAAVVELVVRGGVPDIVDHLVAVHSADGGGFREVWRRSGSDSDSGSLD
jgi:hypothetical protein